MKKLLAALVITLGTGALAGDTTLKAHEDSARVKTGVDATEVGPAIKGAAHDTKQAVKGAAHDTKEATQEAASDIRKNVGIDLAKDGTFNKSKSFTLTGTLKNTGGGGVTVVRTGLPNADLDVRKETLVTLNGKRVDSSDLPEGAAVRARFQLEGEEAVAVELIATSPKAVK